MRGALARPLHLPRRPRADGRRVAGHAGRARLHRRDVGRIDADGYVHLDGRRTDLIISGGVNVYPLEVENALREHPGVEDVAVFGVADEQRGQRVCAVVVGTASPDDLAAHATGCWRLPSDRRPTSRSVSCR